MNLKQKEDEWNSGAGAEAAVLTVLFAVWPERLQLVPLLQLPQPPLDFMKKVGALEAAAVAVKADDDGAEAADQNRGPVHLELLGHHLSTGRTIAVEYRDRTSMSSDKKYGLLSLDVVWEPMTVSILFRAYNYLWVTDQTCGEYSNILIIKLDRRLCPFAVNWCCVIQIKLNWIMGNVGSSMFGFCIRSKPLNLGGH